MSLVCLRNGKKTPLTGPYRTRERTRDEARDNAKYLPAEPRSPWKELNCTPSEIKNCQQHSIRLLFIILEENSFM